MKASQRRSGLERSGSKSPEVAQRDDKSSVAAQRDDINSAVAQRDETRDGIGASDESSASVDARSAAAVAVDAHERGEAGESEIDASASAREGEERASEANDSSRESEEDDSSAPLDDGAERSAHALDDGDPSLAENEAGEAPSTDASPYSAGNELSDDELLQAVSALVFASPEPLSERRLVALLEGPEPARVTAALETLKTRLIESRLPLQLLAIAGGWQIVTAHEMAETVQRLFKARKAERVSPAALETLAVVAYRQPVTKADIEAIRGVQVGPILRTLVDRGFIRVTGRADVPGHPLQYGTTRLFLERFGLSAIDDLPRDSELAKG